VDNEKIAIPKTLEISLPYPTDEELADCMVGWIRFSILRYFATAIYLWLRKTFYDEDLNAVLRREVTSLKELAHTDEVPVSIRKKLISVFLTYQLFFAPSPNP
jgi:hypothetical protein